MMTQLRPINAKRTLLFVTRSEAFGGAEKHLIQRLSRLGSECFRVTIVCTDTDPYTGRFNSGEDVTIVPPAGSPKSFWQWFLFFFRLHPDLLVFEHGSLYCFRWPQYLAARLAGVQKLYAIQHLKPAPVVSKPSGNSLRDRLRRMFGWRSRYVFPWKVMALLARKTICVSEAIRNSLIHDYDYPAKKVLTIPNGVDISEFVPSEIQRASIRKRLGVAPQEVMLVTTARLSQVKGVDVLLGAISVVICHGQTCKCVLVGDGPLRAQLQEQVQRLNLTSYVTFEGFQPDVKPYLQAADIFVLTSWQEGMSLAVLEAMACGLPCVVTDVGGNAEVVANGSEGFVVGPGEVSKIAHAISYLVEHGEDRQRMATQAREKVRRFFDLQLCLEATEKLLLG